MTPDTEFRLLLVIAIGLVIGLCKEKQKQDEDAREANDGHAHR